MSAQPYPRGHDPSRVINQIDIEREIMRLSARLEDETTLYATHIQNAATAEAAFKLAHAKAYLRATGTVSEREAWSDFKTTEEFTSAKQTDALAKSSKEALNSIREQIRALQTLAANLRGQVGQSGY